MAVKNNDGQQFNEKIRNKYLLWVLSITFSILIVLGLLLFSFTYELFLQKVTEKSVARVELASTKIDRWLDSKLSFLQIVGATISGNTGDIHQVSKSLIKAATEQYGAVSIYMGFTNGALLDGSDWVPPEDYDLFQREWYLRAVLNKAPIFTAPYRDVATSKIVTTISCPVYDQNGLLGVIAMDIPIENIDSFLNPIKANKHNRVFLVADNGEFIAHDNKDSVLRDNIKDTPDNALFVQALNAKNNLSLFSQKDYIIISRIPIANWYVVFHLLPSEIIEPLYSLIWVFAAGLVLILLLLGLVLSLISAILAKPIQHLVVGAQNISTGNYDQHMAIERRDELGYLTHSFNEMASGLKERELIRSTFGKYVPHEIISDLLRKGNQLGGDKKEMTFLFCDIRDFTHLSEHRDPSLLVSYLNNFFTEMEQVVAEHNGHINKYLGDGFFALFGAPVPLENSAQQAVAAAHEMLIRLEAFNQEHLSQTKIGIGINTGEALIGNVGSKNRTEYTAIGDAVNLASRIESLCKNYDESLLVSEYTVAKLGPEYIAKAIDKTQVKGRSAPVMIYRTYRLADLSEQQKTELK